MTVHNVAALHAAINAACPIDGVSGDGTIWFQASATPGQRTAAQNILNAFVDSAVPGPTTVIQLQTLPQPKPITAA